MPITTTYGGLLAVMGIVMGTRDAVEHEDAEGIDGELRRHREPGCGFRIRNPHGADGNLDAREIDAHTAERLVASDLRADLRARRRAIGAAEMPNPIRIARAIEVDACAPDEDAG